MFLFGLGSVPPIYSWNAHWMVSDVFWKTDIQGDVNSTTYRVYANRGKKRKYSRAGISFRKEQKQL